MFAFVTHMLGKNIQIKENTTNVIILRIQICMVEIIILFAHDESKWMCRYVLHTHIAPVSMESTEYSVISGKPIIRQIAKLLSCIVEPRTLVAATKFSSGNAVYPVTSATYFHFGFYFFANSKIAMTSALMSAPTYNRHSVNKI